jgi:hypothetical protein
MALDAPGIGGEPMGGIIFHIQDGWQSREIACR